MRGVGALDVFVDANVWFSRTRRDWIGMLYTLPEAPPFAVSWSEDVMAEVVHSLRRQHPTWSGGQVTRVRDLLTQTFGNGRVDDFVVDAGYQGTDPLDAHVHAAAVASRADLLVTGNTRDFVWDDNTSPYEVVSSDEFLVMVDDFMPTLVGEAARRMCAYWLSRAQSADLPANLRRADCPEFAERVRRHLQQLDPGALTQREGGAQPASWKAR